MLSPRHGFATCQLIDIHSPIFQSRQMAPVNTPVAAASENWPFHSSLLFTFALAAFCPASSPTFPAGLPRFYCDPIHTMTEELIISSTPVNGVRVLAFNRPTKRNALSAELISVFLEQLSAAATDKAVRVIVITGTSTFFSGKYHVEYIINLNISNCLRQPAPISKRSRRWMQRQHAAAAISGTFARGCAPCPSL